MQATRKQVFLVDVVQLDIGNEDWNQLGRQIFNNMEILKLGTYSFIIPNCWTKIKFDDERFTNRFQFQPKKGFSPSNDLTMFQKLIPGLSLSSLSLTSYLDLQELWHKLHSMSKFCFPYEGKSVVDT